MGNFQVIQVGSKVTEFVVGDDVAAYLPLDHPASGLAEYVNPGVVKGLCLCLRACVPARAFVWG